MYCKKCGTERKDGQKFCPKCGKPFIDMNIKSLVNEFKKINWKEKIEQASSFLREFMNSPNMIGLTTQVVTCLFVLCLLLREKFSMPIFVYILLATILYLAFMGVSIIKLDKNKAQYTSTALCFVLMLIVGWCSTIRGTNNLASIGKSSSNSKGPHEISIYNDADIIGTNGYMSYDILNNNGNYGVNETYNSGGAIITDVITIPNGKKWKYERDESTAEGRFYSPQIYHYMRGDEKVLNNYRSYKTRNASDVPIFRCGDKILIYVPLSISPREKMSLHLKICFIEADDEFAI